jgi:hypothetical protein
MFFEIRKLLCRTRTDQGDALAGNNGSHIHSAANAICSSD